MKNREIFEQLLSGEQPETTPQWLMSFYNGPTAKRLLPEECHFDGMVDYPVNGSYDFNSMGEERLRRQQLYNKYIDRSAFPAGWGAVATFGHCGPGEFNTRVVSSEEEKFIVEYETGAMREICLHPHNVHTYNLPVKDYKDLDDLVLPNPEDPSRYHGFAQDAAWARSEEEWVVGWINGMFSGVHYFLRDYVDFLMDLASDPDFAKRLIAKIGNWNLAAAKKLCMSGADCIGICDDLGSGTSMLISPEMYRKFIFPWHKKLCDIVHKCGAVVHLHSHGAILPIVPMLVEAGFDILNPVDPDDMMPFAEVRQALGPNIVICGGMNKFFWDWDEKTQYEHLSRVVADGRKYGPHILMDSGGIPDTVSNERFERFLEMSYRIRNQT